MLWHGQNGLGDITNANEILKNNNNSPTPTTTTTTNNNNTNNQAAIFMNEQAKKQQGELEVICLGPLTNLGCCLQVFGEEFIVNVKRFFFFCILEESLRKKRNEIFFFLYFLNYRVNLMGGMVRTLNPGYFLLFFLLSLSLLLSSSLSSSPYILLSHLRNFSHSIYLKYILLYYIIYIL